MEVQPLVEGSSTPCGMQVLGSPLDESLAEWLRVRAGVHERILDKTLRALEEVEVFEVEDLVHLERLPDFALCFSAVTGSKVREALARRAAETAAIAPSPTSPAPAHCAISEETEAGKSNNPLTGPGNLSDAQPHARQAVGFGADSAFEVEANQLDKAARDALRDAREAAVRAARAEAKCAAESAAVRIQAAVRRARVLAVASGPAAFFAPPVLPTLVELVQQGRAWYGDRPAIPPALLAAQAADQAEMVADTRAQPGHLGAAVRAAMDGQADDAEARRRRVKNAKTKARRAKARAAKQAGAEAPASCAMAGETEVGTFTPTITTDPGNLPAPQASQVPHARPGHARAADPESDDDDADFEPDYDDLYGNPDADFDACGDWPY